MTMSTVDADQGLEETRVLAIASHVVHGYVGNRVTTFVLQTLGLEVSAINTVQFSNHTGYTQWKGSKLGPLEIEELFAGLKQSELDDFDMLLTGYIPGADGVEAVARIAKEIKTKRQQTGRGEFFWVLDPVMGDEGKMYVSAEVLPVYKSMVLHADLIVPNQYEVEWLTGVKLNALSDIITAIKALHDQYKIPHIIISSVQLASNKDTLVCAGSSITTTGNPRAFSITAPMLEGPFVGTGDMFAALTVARIREQATKAGVTNVSHWMSEDGVAAIDLPLARTVELVLGSMHKVLARTGQARERKLAMLKESGALGEGEDAKKNRVRYMKTAELQLVQSWLDVRNPEVQFRAEPLE